MKPGEKTKQILLNAACRLFAEKGFHETTMRDITEDANTNVAAINYHFGDKENLYLEAFKHAAEIERELVYEKVKNISDSKKMLETILFLRLESVTQEIPSSWLVRMFHQEIPNPTSMHELIVKEVMSKQRKKLEDIIKVFFEMDLTSGQLDLVFGCFITPVIHQMRHKDRMLSCKDIFPLGKDILDNSERIKMLVCFTMCGFEGLKKEFINEKN